VTAAPIRDAALAALNSRATASDVYEGDRTLGDLPETTVPEPSANGTGHGGQDKGRVRIEITPDEHLVNEQAVLALATAPGVFQRGGVGLVQILRDDAPAVLHGITRPPNAPRIVMLPSAVLRERLAATAYFYERKATAKGEVELQKHPPAFCVEGVLSRGHWQGVPHLEGVVDFPVLRPDGTVLDAPGYDRSAGLLYEPGERIQPVPAFPSPEAIARAKAELLEVVGDFPFEQEAHRAAYLALLLTPPARFAFPGPAPLFLVDSNVRAAGKGLLYHAVSLILMGRDLAVMSNPESEDEARKRITAIALGGDLLVLIDNISGALGSAALDAALTSVVWKDRILGLSEMVEIPLRVVWLATGNNVVLLADTARRVVHIRLNSPLENPEERQDLRHPDLRKWVKAQRPRLVADALTILRGYCAAGRPDQRLRPWGSFEGWSGLVRSAVVWCGLPDPYETRAGLRERSDQEANALAAIIAGVEYLDALGTGLTVSQLLGRMDDPQQKDTPAAQALREALLAACPARGRDFPSPRSIGMKLHHLQGRVVGGKFLHREERDHVGVWSVRRTGGDYGNNGN
jgi:hypothetical protein